MSGPEEIKKVRATAQQIIKHGVTNIGQRNESEVDSLSNITP